MRRNTCTVLHPLRRKAGVRKQVDEWGKKQMRHEVDFSTVTVLDSAAVCRTARWSEGFRGYPISFYPLSPSGTTRKPQVSL